MQRSCIITRIMSLRHLKTESFRLKMDSKKKSDKTLPDWVKVGKRRFDRIKNKVENAKNNNLQARTFDRFVNFVESNKLIQEIAYGNIIHKKALELIISIHDDIDKIISQETLTPNQVEELNILFMADEIFTGKIKFVRANNEGVPEVFEQESNIARQKSTKQPDTADMPDLEDEESAAQGKHVEKDLKIITPNKCLADYQFL